MQNTFGKAIILANEDSRLAALRRYRIVGTDAESSFNSIARLMSQIFNTPTAMISFVDSDYVYFKSSVGMDTNTASRQASFCSLTVLEKSINVIEDAIDDPLVCQNPLVTGEYGLRFYAGAPLITHDGWMIGSVCLIDTEPRSFSESDRIILAGMAKVVMEQIELRLTNIEEAEVLKSAAELLAASEVKMDQILEQLPVNITVIEGPELIIGLTNASTLNYWDKVRAEVIGKPLLDVLPELADQSFPDQLIKVLETGQSVAQYEWPVHLFREDGQLQTTYRDFCYQPILDNHGSRKGVLVMSNDVTEQVEFKKKLEHSERELTETNEHLAQSRDDLLFTIDAAGLGTFDFNPVTGRFTGNDLLKSWFGIAPEDEITLETAIGGIANEDKERVVKAITHALDFTSSGYYDVDYEIINPVNSEQRSIRAKGRAIFNNAQQAVRISGTVQDITEQKKDEIRKNDFIGMVSHELKTPLASIAAIVQLTSLKLKSNRDAYLASAMQKANSQVSKMTKMINGFLDISRLESGKIPILKQEFCMAELIREIVEESRVISPSAMIEICPSFSIPVSADRDKIGSVLTNLISNAIKYSSRDPEVAVKCEVIDRSVIVKVKDNGIGISETDAAKLFDRYYRVDNARTKNISGFGIGLYLSAEIIEHHNGEIGVESVEDVGSIFYFTLPINP